MALGLIFDMDGVLFDSHPIHRRVWRELLQSLGKAVSDEELEFILDGARREEILHHFLGTLSADQVSLYAERKESIFRNEEDDLQMMDGAKVFLDLLEGAAIPKAIATSASKARAQRMLERHDLCGRFAAVLTGDDVPAGKSDPAIFLRSAEALNAAPHEALVFEDAVPAIETVKEIGMKCIGVATGKRKSRLLQAGADLVVSDFTTLGMSDVTRLFE